MNIYIDESGSFVSAQHLNAWNVVAAYAVPEKNRRPLERAISDLKRVVGDIPKKEVKLHELTEQQYVTFLAQLSKLDGCVYFIATDTGLYTSEDVLQHQKEQAECILEHIDKMRFEGGRQGLIQLAKKVENLPPQLYAQLFCQIQLMHEVVSSAVLYFVQRQPSTLGEFRWRIDRKNHIRTRFEEAFETLSPAILQTISLREPLIMFRGQDYSRMKRYEYAPDEMPTYLYDDYGINLRGEGGLNLQKIIRENLMFEDSRTSAGIQAVDLIVSGIRRCLRGEFLDNEKIAGLIGRLMVQSVNNKHPFRLISFGDEAEVNFNTSVAANLMRRHAKRMLVQR